ncbi:hypothetical protein HK405_014377 [Cladochytrium tenue]|nr:hypothetical protein HK405_014377 [Cladochytrium tenue]
MDEVRQRSSALNNWAMTAYSPVVYSMRTAFGATDLENLLNGFLNQAAIQFAKATSASTSAVLLVLGAFKLYDRRTRIQNPNAAIIVLDAIKMLSPKDQLVGFPSSRRGLHDLIMKDNWTTESIVKGQRFISQAANDVSGDIAVEVNHSHTDEVQHRIVEFLNSMSDVPDWRLDIDIVVCSNNKEYIFSWWNSAGVHHFHFEDVQASQNTKQDEDPHPEIFEVLENQDEATADMQGEKEIPYPQIPNIFGSQSFSAGCFNHQTGYDEDWSGENISEEEALHLLGDLLNADLNM